MPLTKYCTARATRRRPMMRTRIRTPVSPIARATRSEFAENQVADRCCDEDRDEDGDHLPAVVSLTDEHHHAGDRAGAGQHRDSKWNDSSVFLLCGFGGLFGGLLCGGALGFEHVQADKKQNDSTGDLEGRERDAEHLEDVLTRYCKCAENDKGSDGGLPGHLSSALLVGSSGDCEKCGSAANGSTRKKMELSASTENCT